MKITTLLIAFAVLSCPAVYGQEDAAAVQTAVSQADLVGTSYTLCVARQDPVYQPDEADTCFEYHLREDGQAIRMFWIDLDTGRIENESITHRAWTLDGGQVIIQGEHQRYGKDPIFYYDVHEIAENGDLLWVRREVDEDGTTETEDLSGDARRLTKGNPHGPGPAKFKAEMERVRGWSQPDEKKYVPKAYWSDVVDQYPARYLRGS